MSGDYRHVVIKPSRLDYKIINYKDNNSDLVKSDWDILREKNELANEELVKKTPETEKVESNSVLFLLRIAFYDLKQSN